MAPKRNSSKVDSRPSFQFYPKDAMSDTNLSMASPAATGLWLRMLCTMFFAPRRGYLVYANGYGDEVAFDAARYARALRWPVDEVRPLWDELVDLGVCNVEPHTGALYCRRMKEEAAAKLEEEKRDLATREARRLAGQKGGKSRAQKAVQNPSKTQANGVSEDLALLEALRKQNPSKSNQEIAELLSKAQASTKQVVKHNGVCNAL